MNLQEIEALYLKRQSCRAFSDKDVPDELVTQICRLSLLAPSACNAQPWELIAVKGERKREVAKGLQDLGMNKFVSDAPVLIAVLEGKSNLTAKLGERLKRADFTHNDIGIMVAHLVLAAEAAGLNTCILGWCNEKKLRAALELDDKANVTEVIALGYAQDGYEIRPKKRTPLQDTYKLLK